MKLRQKTWLIVGTALVSLSMIFWGVTSIVLLRGSHRIDKQFTLQHVERVLETLTNDLALLDRTTLDWASWDDTYHFVANRNLDYLTENYPEDGNTLRYLQLNLVMILDTQGQVVFAQRVDLDTEEVIPISDDFLAQLEPYLPLLQHTESDSRRSGIVPLPEDHLLAASRPILTSDFQGPIQGAMVMGRFLNAREVERLEALTNQPEIALTPFNSPHLPPDFQTTQPRLDPLNQSTVIQPLSHDEIAGYALLEDITGEPGLVLRVVHPRTVYAQGQAILRYLLLSTVATAAIFSGITVILLERGVLSRLKRLSRKVNHIGLTYDLSSRIYLGGQDELTDLAQTINWTLDQLEQVQRSLQQTSEELATSNEELAASNEELEQFAYVASHDLQAPLRKIEAFGKLLQTDCEYSLDEVGKAHLQRIQHSAQQMRALIQDLLDLARVTTQPQPFATVNLTEVAHAVVADLAPQIRQAGAQVTIEPLPTLAADTLQMRQLFQNLLGNAIKFHHPGVPPRVTVTCQVETDAALPTSRPKDSRRGALCQIAIADNGIGFDEKHQACIFKIFQRLHTQDEYEGTGIGLAICTKIVKRHRGTLTATSQPGQGATFTVALPIQPATKRKDELSRWR